MTSPIVGSGGVREGLEAGGEVAEEGRVVDQPHPPELFLPTRDVGEPFENVVEVALRIDPAGKCQPHEFHGGGHEPTGILEPAEHRRSDLAAADALGQIELAGQRLAGKLAWRHVRRKRCQPPFGPTIWIWCPVDRLFWGGASIVYGRSYFLTLVASEHDSKTYA